MPIHPALKEAIVEAVKTEGENESVATQLVSWVEAMSEAGITEEDIQRRIGLILDKLASPQAESTKGEEK